jgi:hypothetical protein
MGLVPSFFCFLLRPRLIATTATAETKMVATPIAIGTKGNIFTLVNFAIASSLKANRRIDVVSMFAVPYMVPLR